jgi:hypothetical protein
VQKSINVDKTNKSPSPSPSTVANPVYELRRIFHQGLTMLKYVLNVAVNNQNVYIGTVLINNVHRKLKNNRKKNQV